MTSDLLVAAIAAGSTLAGGMLGISASLVLDRRGARREHAQRWEERRIAVYVAFLDDLREFSDLSMRRISGALGGDEREQSWVVERTSAHHQRIAQVRIMAGPDVWHAATELIDAFESRSQSAVDLAMFIARSETSEPTEASVLQSAMDRTESVVDKATAAFAAMVQRELGADRIG